MCECIKCKINTWGHKRNCLRQIQTDHRNNPKFSDKWRVASVVTLNIYNEKLNAMFLYIFILFQAGCLSQCMLGYTPLGVGLETPPMRAWIPPLGVGLETPPVWAWRPARHAGIPPPPAFVDRQTPAKTWPSQTTLAGGNKDISHNLDIETEIPLWDYPFVHFNSMWWNKTANGAKKNTKYREKSHNHQIQLHHPFILLTFTQIMVINIATM